MDWNNAYPDERIRLWKNFRESINYSNIDEQLLQVAHFFSNVPIEPRTIDYYTPDTWPTPWEILYNGKWCNSSVSLLMFYTLDLLPNYKDINLELALVDDTKDRYLLLRIANQYVLNFIPGQVSTQQDIIPAFRIMALYTSEHIKKIKRGKCN